MDTTRSAKVRPLPSTTAESRPMCSCALSRTFPFCDGSQMISKSNRAGELVSCGVATPAKLPETADKA